MHIETQTKTNNPPSFLIKTSFKTIYLIGLLATLTACSFVELKPGAENIIFAKQGDGCETIKTFTAEVKTSTLFINRRPKAIAEELQILAQNEAYAIYANAIWPNSDIEEGKQEFDLLRCNSK
jgi:hypothetical protein